MWILMLLLFVLYFWEPILRFLIVKCLFGIILANTPGPSPRGASRESVALYKLMRMLSSSSLHTKVLILMRLRTHLLRLFLPEISDQVIRSKETITQGVKVEWFVPKNNSLKDFIVLHAHGGGYATGSVHAYAGFLERLALRLNARILSVDYKRTPEHPYPHQVNEFAIAYEWLTQQKNVDPDNIVLMGDSAGGNIIFSFLHQLSPKARRPRVAVGICPQLDLTDSRLPPTCNDQLVIQFNDPVLTLDTYNGYMKFLGINNATKRQLSVFFAQDLSFLPEHTLVQASDTELLWRQNMEFAQRAEKKITFQVFKDQMHDWHLFMDLIPEGQQAVNQIVEFIQRHI